MYLLWQNSHDARMQDIRRHGAAEREWAAEKFELESKLRQLELEKKARKSG